MCPMLLGVYLSPVGGWGASYNRTARLHTKVLLKIESIVLQRNLGVILYTK